MQQSPSTRQAAASPSRPNRDGLGYGVAALALDLLAMALILIDAWYLTNIGAGQASPRLDQPRANPLQALLTIFLLFMPFFLAGWGRLWGVQARALAVMSIPPVQRLAQTATVLAIVNVIAALLVLISLPFRS